MSLLDAITAPLIAELSTLIYPAVLTLLGLFLAFAIAVYGLLFVMSLFVLNKEDNWKKDVADNAAWLTAFDEHKNRDWTDWGAAWDDASGTGSADVGGWSSGVHEYAGQSGRYEN